MTKKTALYDRSALIVFISIILLFLSAIAVTLIGPSFVDPTWTQPSSYYQVQMYEVVDPNVYISSASKGAFQLEFIQHLKAGFTLHSFQESKTLRILAPKELEQYVTRIGEEKLKLTTRLLLVRNPTGKAKDDAEKLRQSLQQKDEGSKIDYSILELYDPGREEAFSLIPGEGVESFVDQNFEILEKEKKFSYQNDPGVIYINNPREYRVSRVGIGIRQGWQYDPNGKPIETLEELTGKELGFLSRKELIALGEHIYAIEGCWYCHTDQTRTLIQDTVLNGGHSYPAPPSSPNEYIYQQVTFPGTRRIGPDMSRVGIKRPARDWHKSHFWSPRTASPGSIMPSFRHFFDDDPRGTAKSPVGIPNYKFEAIFQYLMTKGTRITPPTQAWWQGRDPVNTLEIIEGKKVIKQ